MQNHLTGTQILEELKRLDPGERLSVIEKALRETRVNLWPARSSGQEDDLGQRLTAAAESLAQDYRSGGDLTAFTALDGEDLYASR